MDIRKMKSLDQFIAEARRLRAVADEAEACFLMFLYLFEREREDLWRTDETATFEALLQSSAIVNVARFRNFCAGVDRVADPVATGAAATIEAGHFRSTDRIQEYQERCDAFRQVHDGSPSKQTAQKWRQQLDQPPPRVVGHATRLAQLTAENQKLKAEKKDLERKLQEANKAIAKLQAELQRARGGRKGKPGPEQHPQA